MLHTAADATTAISVNLGLLLGLLVISALLNPARGLDRTLFGGTTAVFVLSYAYWRWHDTLPPLALEAESLWPHVFFPFEMAAILYVLLSILILCRTIDRSGQADRAQAKMQAERSWPAVDVFIATYDEPRAVLERSILGAAAIDYPHFTVWVLDDTRRDWLRDYCAEAGVRYVTRPDNKGAKAGNLNNGLMASARDTNSPVILLLDADFWPHPNILTRTVGLLDNPGVATVQTPQFYANADPIQHNLMAQHSWVDDQRFFFDRFEPAKDAWGCAFCVGTSCVFRRDRLNEIGGFPAEAITEDLNVSYKLLAKGAQTWWLNEPLSRGLAAEGLPEYLTQRSRWCLGTIQVGLLRDGPLRGRGYSVTHRWQYFHGVLNWLCKPFIILMLIAPSIYWFAGLPAFEADYLSFLRYGVPAVLAQLVYMSWVSGRRTLPLFTEATHAIAAFTITATLLSAIVKPFGRPFKITEKGADRSGARVHRGLAWMFGALTLSSVGCIVWALVSPNAASEISPQDLFNLVWAGVAVLVSFVAFVACFERPREEIEFPVGHDTFFNVRGGLMPCRIARLSSSTALLENVTRLPDDGELYVPGVGWVDATSNGNTTVLALHPTAEQRRRLIVRLLASAPVDLAEIARLRSALAALFRRGFAVGRS
jgi:cellulose synthase (UDP-forming)